MTTAPKSKTQSLRALDSIRTLIFSGELAAGSDHLEGELADRLQMSRTPVREALLVLATQGLVEVRPRRGVRILSFSVDDLNEIYEVLTELESLSAYRAARAGHSEKALSLLKSSLDEMENSVAAKDLLKWAQADAQYHQQLVKLAGNTRIESIVSAFNDQVRRARALTLHLRPTPNQSNDDHRALYEAIKRGDGDAARTLHWQHRVEARELLVSLLESLNIKYF